MKYFFLILFLSIVAASCVQPPQNENVANSNANSASNPKWDAYVEQFLNNYFAANPTFAVYQGKHEYDGKFPDWSQQGLANEIARLKSEREKATAFKDNELDERQRSERDYLISQIDKDLF